MNLHKMIEICLKDDNMHIFVMINALICINNYVITCINSMLSDAIFLCKDSSWHNVVICARVNVMLISRSCGDSCRLGNSLGP